MRTDLRMIDALDEEIRALELYLTRHAKIDDPQTYHLLKTIPGRSDRFWRLILLYEIHRIDRFPEVGNFASYASAGAVRNTKAPAR